MTQFVDTTLRDAHQSLIATRMRTEDLVKIAELLDKAGYYSLECWGGATFEVAMRFLKEDPWERLSRIREAVKRAKLQMLLRGQNVVGYWNYPDDVVRKFVEKAYEHGLDIFRIFDALNDPRNFEVAIDAVKKTGAEIQAAISYTISPIHTLDKYLEVIEELLSMGADTICIKDMAGLATPPKAIELIKAIKSEFKVPVDFHTHCTTGLGYLSAYEAIKVGADRVDTAVAPLAGGSAQPPIQTLYYAFKGTEHEIKLDIKVIDEIGKILGEWLRTKYSQYVRAEAYMINDKMLKYQVPGGMLSNLIKQLEDMKRMDVYEKVLEEIPVVRKDLGYPPLVTPTSQIVGVQAVLNVISGRYKMITKEVKNYLKGFYGRPPGEINPELYKLAKISPDEVIKVRPGSLLPPGLPKAEEELKKLGIPYTEEDVISMALFPDVAKEFLLEKYKGKMKKSGWLRMKLKVGGREYVVEVKRES